MADKTCKYCSMIIPSGAKVCPHCRKNVGFYLTWPAKIFIIAFGLPLLSFIGWKIQSAPASPTAATSDRQLPHEEALTEKGKAVKAKHPAWTNTICNAVANREIVMGMIPGMVVASLGKPDAINKSVGSWGVKEQWVYRKYDSYLYFKNDVLASWQTPGK